MCNLGTTFSINFHVSCAFLVLVLGFFLPLGLVIFPLSVDLEGGGGPSQCLNFGPGSEPRVNRRLDSLFLGYASDLSYFFLSFFRCVLDLSPFIRLKATHCPGQYLFWGHSSAFYYTRNPSLCWPLASSGSSGIPTWFSRPRPLAFSRPEPLQGRQYSWQVLRLAEPDFQLIVWGGGPFGNYTFASRRTFLQAFQGKFQRESLRF